MRVAVFSTKPYDRRFFDARYRPYGHELHYLEPRLTAETAPPRARASRPSACSSTTSCDRPTLETLAAGGTRLVALRCAGFNNVDLAAAARARHRGRPGAGLLAARGGRVHGRPDPDCLNRQHPPRLQPHPRQQFRARRPARLRPARQDGGRRSAPARSAPWSRAIMRAGLRLRGAGARSPCPTRSWSAIGVRYVARRASSPRAPTSITLHCPLTPADPAPRQPRAASRGPSRA